MAKAVAIGKLKNAYGQGIKVAVGTVRDLADAGSFAVYLDTAGSKIMRNIQAVFLQPMKGTYSYNAYGSSSGYVHVEIERQTGGTTELVVGTCDFNFLVFAGPGSIPA